MADTIWHATLVARTPQAVGPPTLTEIGFLPWDSIVWNRALNEPGTHDVTCETDALADVIRARLRNIKVTPNEVWLYRDGVVVAAGPLTQWSIEDTTITLRSNGLLYYLKYLRWSEDYFTPVDQALQVKDLIDTVQGRYYGHYGLNTNFLVDSGTPQYYGIVGEQYDPVLGHVYKLGEYENGFDLECEPASREVIAHHPKQGTDKSAVAVLDYRTIISPHVAQFADADSVCSDAIVFGDNDQGARTVIELSDGTFITQWGRAELTRTGNEFSNAESATRAVYKMLADGKLRIEEFTPEIRQAAGFEVDTVSLGDTIMYAYDAGLGLERETRRIIALTVTVEGNEEKLGLTI